MNNLGKYALIALGAIGAGITGGYLLTQLIARRTEEKLGGKLMKVHYRFTKDFDDKE